MKSIPVSAQIDHPFVSFDKQDTQQSIGIRFHSQVQQHGERSAIESENGSFTYAELDRLSNRVARALLHLLATGGSGSPVLLLFDHNPSMIIAMLGALKAGAPYVPIDPSYPVERINQISENSGAHSVLTEELYVDSIEQIFEHAMTVINLNVLPSEIPGSPPDVRVEPDQIAYILYTSGSTGVPKGVIQSHRNVLCNIRHYTNDIHISQTDRLSLLTSFSFAASVSDLFGGLLNGATVCLYDLHRHGMKSLPGWIRQNRITIYYSVPSVFRLWASSTESTARFPHLRVTKLGGDRVTHSDVKLYRDRFADTCVLQITLGATEINLVSRYLIDKRTPVPAEAVPVGYPPEDVELDLVNQHGDSVLTGETGELVIRSPHLALGYWNQPAPTNARLFADPDDATRRVYWTGDLGRFLPDRCLVHLGRSDTRIKIRGQSVEMAEVELALTAIEDVQEAVVVNQPDSAGEARLVAYVVPARPGVTASGVRSALDRVLPGFMVPGAFIFIATLPLNVHGKIDRNALLALDVCGTPECETGGPRTEVEERLCRIWSQVLNTPRVGIHDGFRDLGGHSLQAMSLIDAINEKFDAGLSPRVLLESDTVHKLANILARPVRVGDWSPLVRIKPDGSESPVFMMHALDGHVLGYLELARCLPDELPLYGLEARGMTVHQEPYTSVHGMASLYIDAIRRIQPRGPYRLGGFSLGGIIAYEMACQLSDDQQRVEFLLIGDAWVLRGVHFKPLRYRLSQFTYPFTVKPGQWVNIIGRKLGIWEIPQPARRGWGAPELRERMVRAHKQAASRYQARAYPGKVTVLRSEEYFRKVRRLQHYFGGPAMGWDRLARGGVELHSLPGRHFDLFGAANAPRVAGVIMRTLSTPAPGAHTS
ncbi:MAG: amino acid adenylation domain-containing protein [Gammaproteobacteria bacterium]|nr:amino acid adenylation domain-containing protein [Gammaproteobacteria bacterium]